MGEDKHLTESDPNPFSKMDVIPGIGLVKKFGDMILCVIFRDNDNSDASALIDRELYENE